MAAKTTWFRVPARPFARWGMMATMLGVAGMAVGCGGAARPTQTQSDAVASVRAAEAVGATEHPRASYHLQLANEQVASAEQWMARGDNERARALLERARADADLAVALAREGQTLSEAQAAREHIDALRRGTI